MQWLMQVCKDAGVELHVVPLTDEYWDRVVAHSIAEIKTGRTPNPDILCNSRCVMHAKLIGGNVYCKLGMYSTSQCVFLVMRGLFETLSRSIVQRRAKHQCAHVLLPVISSWAGHDWAKLAMQSWISVVERVCP